MRKYKIREHAAIKHAKERTRQFKLGSTIVDELRVRRDFTCGWNAAIKHVLSLELPIRKNKLQDLCGYKYKNG